MEAICVQTNNWLYSVDSSIFIEIHQKYPQDIFPEVWKFLGNLANKGRLKICEQVLAECRDEDLQKFFSQNKSNIVVPLADYEVYLSALLDFTFTKNINLVRVNKQKTEADPFVIALALKLDDRDEKDIRSKSQDKLFPQTCWVASMEASRSPVKIPRICRLLDLRHVS
ncbi:MAG: DUF4411 family protein, partial [Candidatus Methanomethyliaceae archaeon]